MKPDPAPVHAMQTRATWKQLLEGERPLLLPCAHDALSARRSASSRPCIARASVRAMMKVSGLRRAAAAARSLAAITWASITSLPAMWPQRLGARWSSMKIAATPIAS